MKEKIKKKFSVPVTQERAQFAKKSRAPKSFFLCVCKFKYIRFMRRSHISVYTEDQLFLIAEEYDAYIIVSFVNATLVLSIGETVEEVTDSGFLGTTPTLSCSALGEDALVQVYIAHRSYIVLYSMAPW